MTKNLYLGVMSGTSVDAIDIVAVKIFDDSFNFIDAKSFTFDEELRNEILKKSRNSIELKESELWSLDQKLAHAYGLSINEFISKSKIKKNDISAVGLHGQTIIHQPEADNPFSLQLGNSQIVTEITDLIIIDDFRSADIKSGGQGAPLAPIFHSFLFGQKEGVRSVVNIGGISNISFFRSREALKGYDLGPGNILMDSWSIFNGIGEYDEDGKWARTGTECVALSEALRKQDNFLDKKPPKSTGSDYYNLEFILEAIAKCNVSPNPEDVQRTLLEYTANLFRGLNKENILETEREISTQIAICGGGAKNNFLIERIEDLMEIPRNKLQTTEAWGVKSEWVEAIGFAYLAFLRLNEKSVNLSKITGSNGDILLGKVTLPKVDYD